MNQESSNLGAGSIGPEDAARILQSGEYSRRRGYLSKTITTWNQIAVSGTIAIWAFFIPRNVIAGDKTDYEFFTNQVAVASALSAFFIGLWRFYVRFLDKSIISLYPIMYLCERILSPEEACTLSPPKPKGPKGKTLAPLNKTTALRPLKWEDIKNSDYSSRGHTFIDLLAVCIILAFGAVSVWIALHFKTAAFVPFGRPNLIGYMLFGNIAGLVFILLGWICWKRGKHRWPVPDPPD
jgi:hypothetical protein